MHPFFHFLSRFHFSSRASPGPSFLSESSSFLTCCERAFLWGHCVLWRTWTGRQREEDGRLPPIGCTRCRAVRGCAALAQRRAAPPPPRPEPGSCVCHRGGVSSEPSPPPASAAAASRGLPESGGRGERVWICLDGNCCVSTSRRPARWVAPSSGASCFSDPTPRRGSPHTLGCVRVEWDPRTRVSLDSYGAERQGGKGSPGRLHTSYRLGGPGIARRGPRRKRGQPRLSAAAAVAAAVQFEVGRLKTRTRRPGRRETDSRQTAVGIAAGGREARPPRRRAHSVPPAPETDRAAGTGGTLCPLPVHLPPAAQTRGTRKGLERGRDTGVLKQSFG